MLKNFFRQASTVNFRECLVFVSLLKPRTVYLSLVLSKLSGASVYPYSALLAVEKQHTFVKTVSKGLLQAWSQFSVVILVILTEFFCVCPLQKSAKKCY